MLSPDCARISLINLLTKLFLALSILSYLICPSLILLIVRNILYSVILRTAPGLTLRQAFFYCLAPVLLALLQHTQTETGGTGIIIDFFGPVPGGTSNALVFFLEFLLAILGLMVILIIFQPLPPTLSSRKWVRYASRAMSYPLIHDDEGPPSAHPRDRHGNDEEQRESIGSGDSDYSPYLPLPPTKPLLVITISSTIRRYWSVVYGEGESTSSSSSFTPRRTQQEETGFFPV